MNHGVEPPLIGRLKHLCWRQISVIWRRSLLVFFFFFLISNEDWKLLCRRRHVDCPHLVVTSLTGSFDTADKVPVAKRQSEKIARHKQRTWRLVWEAELAGVHPPKFCHCRGVLFFEMPGRLFDLGKAGWCSRRRRRQSDQVWVISAFQMFLNMFDLVCCKRHKEASFNSNTSHLLSSTHY